MNKNEEKAGRFRQKHCPEGSKFSKYCSKGLKPNQTCLLISSHHSPATGAAKLRNSTTVLW